MRRIPIHWTTVTQLILVFLLFGLSHLTGIILSRGDYTPFSVGESVSAQVFDETQLYTPGPRRYERERKVVSEIDVRELKSRSNGYPTFHSYFIGVLAQLTGNLEIAWMMLHAFLPVVVWSISFYLLKRHSKNRWAPTALSWIFVILPFSPRHSILIGADALYQPLELSRMPHPLLSYLLLLGCLALVARAMNSSRIRDQIIAGVLCGGCFYAYYFYWIALFAGLVMWIVFSRASQEAIIVKRLCRVLTTGLFVGTPYLFRVYLGFQEKDQTYLLNRVGMFSHWPSFAHLVLFIILVMGFGVLILKFRKRVSTETTVLMAAMVGGVIGLNLHVITGYNAQHTHYFNRLLQPTGFLLASLFCLVLLDKMSTSQLRWARLLIIGFACFIVSAATFRQIYSAAYTLNDHRRSSPDYDILAKLRSRMNADEVAVTTDPKLALLIPGIVGSWSFVPVADRTMASSEEILRRYLLASQLEGLDLRESLARLSLRAPNDDRLWLHTSYVFFQNTVPDPKVRERAVELWPNVDPARDLAFRAVDYVIIPRSRDLDSIRQFFPKCERVDRNEKWAIVKTGPMQEINLVVSSER